MGFLESQEVEVKIVSYLLNSDARCKAVCKHLGGKDIDAVTELLVSIFCEITGVDKTETVTNLFSIRYRGVIVKMVKQFHATPNPLEPRNYCFDKLFKLEECSRISFRVKSMRDGTSGDGMVEISCVEELEDKASDEGGHESASQDGIAIENIRVHGHSNAANVVQEGERAVENVAQLLREKVVEAIKAGDRDSLYRELDELNLYLLTGKRVNHCPQKTQIALSLENHKYLIVRALHKFLRDIKSVKTGNRNVAKVEIPLGEDHKYKFLLEYCNDRPCVRLLGVLSDDVAERWKG